MFKYLYILWNIFANQLWVWVVAFKRIDWWGNEKSTIKHTLLLNADTM